MKWAVIALVCAAGCAGAARPDPESDRFATGAEAVSYHAESDTVALMDLPEGNGILRPGNGHWSTFNVMPRGLRVRVISDVEASDKPEVRKVRCLILEGDYRGMEANLWRRQLRPIPPVRSSP